MSNGPDNSKKFTSVFAKALQISESEVTDSARLEDLPTWDSFNSLILISELEKAFGVSFSVKEISEVRSVSDIKTNLRAKGIEL